MMKKLFTAFMAALACSTASAGFLQYDLHDVRFNDGATLIGYFVQDTDDRSIAYYTFNVISGSLDRSLHFSPSGSFDNIISAQTFFRQRGPTSFHIYDEMTDAFGAELVLIFTGRPNGPYVVGGWEIEVPLFGLEEHLGPARSRHIVSGYAVEGVIHPVLEASLEYGYRDGLYHIVPTQRQMQVLEPSSLALLFAGALAAARFRRWRKV